jgi:hypothetical protein
LKAERLAMRLMSSAVFPVVKRSVITGPGEPEVFQVWLTRLRER